MKELKSVDNNIRTEAEMTLLKEIQRVMAAKTIVITQITFINGHAVHWERINGEWCGSINDLRNAFSKDEIAQSSFLSFLTKQSKRK